MLRRLPAAATAAVIAALACPPMIGAAPPSSPADAKRAQSSEKPGDRLTKQGETERAGADRPDGDTQETGQQDDSRKVKRSGEAGEKTRKQRELKIPHKPVAVEQAAREIVGQVRQGQPEPMLFLLRSPASRKSRNDPIAIAMNRVNFLSRQIWSARERFLKFGAARFKTVVRPGIRPGESELTTDEARAAIVAANAWGLLEASLVTRNGGRQMNFRLHVPERGVTDWAVTFEPIQRR